MRKKWIACFLVAVLVFALFALPVGAFDGNDYGGDSGGGWDSGGSWDSGSSWDSGDSWDSGGGSGSRYSCGRGFSMLLVIAIAVAIVVSQINKKSPVVGGTGTVRSSTGEGRHIMLPDRTAQIEGIIRSHDPGFSAGSFLTFVKRVYIDIQTAWCRRDMSPVRVLLHDNLYDATVKQVQAKIQQGVVYHYESMVVNTAYLTSYARDNQFEYLTVYLNARMIDWQEDERTGRILRGDRTTRWDLRYKMTFMRPVGMQTRKETPMATVHNCPNCGAPLEMTSSAKCRYCNSVVRTGSYNWVLSDFGTIRNDTIDEGIRIGR